LICQTQLCESPDREWRRVRCESAADIPFVGFGAGSAIHGWSLGGGLEVMVMPKAFLRAEYEYIAFAPVWEIKALVQTARVSLGCEF
jgi:opacity protein-like surface antigen